MLGKNTREQPWAEGTQEDTLEHRRREGSKKAPRGEKNKTHITPKKKEKDKPDMRQLRVPNNGGAPLHFGGKVIEPIILIRPNSHSVRRKNTFWVVPSVRRVLFPTNTIKNNTSSDTLAKAKNEPERRHGLQEPVKLFLSGDEAWKILSAVWEENPNDLILGSGRERMG